MNAEHANNVTIHGYRPADKHAGDCTIYAALRNGSPTDGICTCGHGWSLVREGDWSEMYSKERQEDVLEQDRCLNGP